MAEEIVIAPEPEASPVESSPVESTDNNDQTQAAEQAAADAVADGQRREVERAARKHAADVAQKVYAGSRAVEKLQEAEFELRDDLPYKDWARLRNDQISGKLDERIQQARENQKSFSAALAGFASVNAAEQAQAAQQAPITPDYFPPQDIDAVVEQRIVQREHAARVEAARSEHPDWDAVAQRAIEAGDVQFHPVLVESLVALPNSGDVVYALASDVALARKIAAMPAARALAELGRLSGSLAHRPGPRDTMAPSPPKPVTARGGISHADLEDLPYKEFVKAREQARKSR